MNAEAPRNPYGPEENEETPERPSTQNIQGRARTLIDRNERAKQMFSADNVLGIKKLTVQHLLNRSRGIQDPDPVEEDVEYVGYTNEDFITLLEAYKALDPDIAGIVEELEKE